MYYFPQQTQQVYYSQVQPTYLNNSVSYQISPIYQSQTNVPTSYILQQTIVKPRQILNQDRSLRERDSQQKILGDLKQPSQVRPQQRRDWMDDFINDNPQYPVQRRAISQIRQAPSHQANQKSYGLIRKNPTFFDWLLSD